MGIENKIRYREWLRKSDKWANVKLEAMVWMGTKCQGCNKDDFHNDVHHIRYPSRWDDTKMWFLRILCRKCHNKIHKLTEPHKYKYRKEAQDFYLKAVNGIRSEHSLMPITKYGRIMTPQKRLNRLKIRLMACNPFRNVGSTKRDRIKITGKCVVCEVDPAYASVFLKENSERRTRLCLDCFHFWITAKIYDLTELFVRGRYKKKKRKLLSASLSV